MTAFDENEFSRSLNRLECLKLAQSAEDRADRCPLLGTVMDRAEDYADFVNEPAEQVSVDGSGWPPMSVEEEFAIRTNAELKKAWDEFWRGDLTSEESQPMIVTAAFTFSEALDLLKEGERVARSGWNGKSMWLAHQVPDEFSKMSVPYIYMSTAQGDFVPWLASQTDLLAEDWYIV